MAKIPAAKILAQIIKAYRAAYVSTAGLASGGTNMRSALLNAIMKSKIFAPPSKQKLLTVDKIVKDILASTK